MPRRNKEAGEGRATELLEGNHRIVKLIIIYDHLLFLHSPQVCYPKRTHPYTRKSRRAIGSCTLGTFEKYTFSFRVSNTKGVLTKEDKRSPHKHELSLDKEDQSLHGTSATIHAHEKKQNDVPVSRKCSKHDEGTLRQSRSSDCNNYDQEGAHSQASKTDGKHVHKQR